MKVNKEIIAKLNPCTDRFNNYIQHYGDKTFTKQQFMGLKHITHKDKLWVAFRLIPKNNIQLAVADIAESVLEVFEYKCPNDLRPRRAIEAVRSGSSDPTSAVAARILSAAAYYASSDARAASNVTDSDARAASNAADAAAYAVAASAYDSTYESAYYAAARTAEAAAYSAKNQQPHEKLIRKIVMKYWK